MRLRKKTAQTTFEYVMVVSLVAAALMGLYSTVSYLMQGRLGIVSDYVADNATVYATGNATP